MFKGILHLSHLKKVNIILRVELIFSLPCQACPFQGQYSRDNLLSLGKVFQSRKHIFSARPNYTHPNLKMPVAPNFRLTYESCSIKLSLRCQDHLKSWNQAKWGWLHKTFHFPKFTGLLQISNDYVHDYCEQKSAVT